MAGGGSGGDSVRIVCVCVLGCIARICLVWCGLVWCIV